MAGDLIAERMVEDVDDGAGVGGLARYALYGAAGVAALIGAWLIAGPRAVPVPETSSLTVRSTELPTPAIRQIDLGGNAPAVAPATAAVPAAIGAPAPEPAVDPQQTAAIDPAPIPPKPLPRPVRPAAAKVVQASAPVREAPVMPVQVGEPPRDLGVLHQSDAASAEPVYAPEAPAAQPAVAAAPSGPVPPMPIEGTAEEAPPAGAPVHHQGLLGASERAVGSAWNWTTGAIKGAAHGVQQSF